MPTHFQSRFSGENFTRASGEASEVQNLQLFAWQSAQRGHDIHVHANPTEGEILHKQFVTKKEQLKETNKGSILSKYGGEEYLEKAPKELLLGQTEDYAEYSQTGRVLKGRERAKTRSKYAEDGRWLWTLISSRTDHVTLVYINNHTHVWGSWYDPSTSSWGYACCHSTVHISYCTGQAGIEAAAASSAKNLLISSSKPLETVPQPIETVQVPSKEVEERRRAAKNAFSKERVGEGEVQLDRERLAQALKEEKKRKARGDDDGRSGKRAKGDEPSEVTEEQLGKKPTHNPIGRADTDSCNRGVQDEQEQDGRSYGQLRRHRGLRTSSATRYLFFIVHATDVFLFNHHIMQMGNVTMEASNRSVHTLAVQGYRIAHTCAGEVSLYYTVEDK